MEVEDGTDLEIGIYSANEAVESVWLGRAVAHHSLRCIGHDVEWMFSSDGGIVCHPLSEYPTELLTTVRIGRTKLWGPMVVAFMKRMEQQGWTEDNYQSTGKRNCISFVRAVLQSFDMTIPSSFHLVTSAALYDCIRKFSSDPAPGPLSGNFIEFLRFISKSRYNGKRPCHISNSEVTVCCAVWSRRVRNPDRMQHVGFHNGSFYTVELTRHKQACITTFPSQSRPQPRPRTMHPLPMITVIKGHLKR